jgi:hypothetical protein
MKLLSNQARRFFFGFALMLVVFQLTHGIAHAKIYSPVDIQPYDEQSKKILENGIKRLSSSFEMLQNQETKSFEKALSAYEENPTDENYASAVEKNGQGLYTKIKTMKDMENAILKVTPELGKYRAFLKKDGNSEKLEAIELLQSSLEAIKENLKKRIKVFEAGAKRLVTRVTIEATMKDVFPSSGGLQKGIVNGLKDLDKFLELTIQFNDNEKSYLNIEECRQGWEDVRSVIEDSGSKFGY